jgi:hypothetical protein
MVDVFFFYNTLMVDVVSHWVVGLRLELGVGKVLLEFRAIELIIFSIPTIPMGKVLYEQPCAC